MINFSLLHQIQVPYNTRDKQQELFLVRLLLSNAARKYFEKQCLGIQSEPAQEIIITDLVADNPDTVDLSTYDTKKIFKLIRIQQTLDYFFARCDFCKPWTEQQIVFATNNKGMRKIVLKINWNNLFLDKLFGRPRWS